MAPSAPADLLDERTSPAPRRVLRTLPWAATLSLALIGCGATPDAAPVAPPRTAATTAAGPATTAAEVEPPVAGLGETVRFEGVDGTVGTITLHRIRRAATAESGEGPAPVHGSFVYADFSVAIDEGVGMVSPLTFEAHSPDGTTYPAASGVVADRLDVQQLDPGRKARGDVAFDVPEGVLHIDYVLSGRPLARFRVVT